MVLPAPFDPFVAAAPLSVMTRALLERTFQAAALNQLFLDNANTQYPNELLYSSVVEMLAQVALRINRSVRQSYLNNPAHRVVSLTLSIRNSIIWSPSRAPWFATASRNCNRSSPS